MNKNENSFLDPKTILAVLLVGGLWFGWQSYLAKKYPQMNAPKNQVVEGEAGKNNPSPAATNAQPQPSMVTPSAATAAAVAVASTEEKKISVSSDQATFEISSLGMGLKNLKLNHYTRRDKTNIEFAKGLPEGLFELHLLDDPRPLNFTIESNGTNSYVGTAQVGNMKVIRTLIYQPESFSFKNNISVINAEATFKGFSVIIPEKKEASTSSGSFLTGNYDHQEILVSHDGNKSDTTNITSAKESVDKNQGQVSILSLASQYFAAAVIDKSDIAPEAKLLARKDDNFFQGILSYKVGSLREKMDFNFISYVGPKSHETLEKADPDLGGIIDLGFFGPIGRVLLVILKWFNGFTGNWGLSIIALTILVRMLVMPFNIASYKSMKKMQKIQPLLKALKERYKDDPKAQQAETMAIMKREKVNPIGGCLPMLLQMPIFFAFFRTLGQNIDLYQAPFVFWIHDLSLKDPYYILPILVGITFFVQQKITPTTMDPQQAKIMQFMPIMFTFFMISLPSGLTLYTFVSTLFGILQQRFFMRDRHTLATAREAKA